MLAALRFEQTDICPYYIWIHEDMLRPLSQQYGVEDVKATVIRDHQQVRAETRRCIEVMGAGGGYVVAPAKPILSIVPLANVVVLVDTTVGQ